MFQETADFSYAEFRDGSKFKDTVFKTSPCFHEAVIESNTTLPKAEDLPDRYSPNASNNYRFLRQLAQVKLDDSEVQKFRALELESRLNTHHDKGENVLSACYKAINNYGLNLWRPLYLLIALFAVSLELYTLIELQHPTHEVLAGCPEALAGKPICPALGNALKSILEPSALEIPKAEKKDITYTVQTNDNCIDLHNHLQGHSKIRHRWGVWVEQGLLSEI